MVHGLAAVMLMRSQRCGLIVMAQQLVHPLMRQGMCLVRNMREGLGQVCRRNRVPRSIQDQSDAEQNSQQQGPEGHVAYFTASQLPLHAVLWPWNRIHAHIWNIWTTA
jgi:hypothetical protein